MPVPDCAVAARACPAPCSLGHEQFRDLTSCARLSPEPNGRDLAEVALADLAMTRRETVRPHLGVSRPSDLFSILACELGAPLRNRTVDLLLTMHAGFVWHRRIKSDCRSSQGSQCLGTSRCVGRSLESLSLTLSLGPGLPPFKWTTVGPGEPGLSMTIVP